VGDRQRLTQALVQLADNAARYTGRGDPIWLGSAVVDSEARLWVRDSGPGVAPQDRERIFGRFARATRAGGGEGTGLGLAIVKAIVEAHHGRIEVGAAPAGGARFTLFVPVDQPPPPEDVSTSEVHPGRLP
jgi:signal transduction histidine kinase